ncbi:hypothetical protein [Rhodoplanes roseus]|uniref:Protease HtpX n=1 Tax=Rhodoplanes roseus TaxID=29409 RepID=A0A327KZV7_9BRAD|nr:hypothetical protein [Rhodoplanes roseus]RAI44420.1 hypothetical protein CH341_09110 [Rhodoplanes roseus]
MKALVLYVLFVVLGAGVAAGISYYIENSVSEAAGLITFLALFFANFAVSWILVILAMDGSLRNATGRAEQLAIEASGRRAH